MHAIRGTESLLLVRHRNHTGLSSSALNRLAARGELTSLRSGAFVRTAVWNALSSDERIRLEVATAAAVHRGSFTATHRSSAALWGVPRIRRHDGLVHQRVSASTGTRTEAGIRKHAVADTELHLAEIAGIVTTNLERTVLDLAATEPFAAAVTAADWALRHHTTKDRLVATLEEWSPTRGRARIERVIAFADGRSGGPGESVSRVQIHECGLTPPVLQQRFDDELGLIGFVDFFWPDFDVIGEFDGLVKYRKPEFMNGRTDSEVVVDEKRREDRLRALPQDPTVSRWIWATLRPVGQLESQLRRVGVR